MKLLPLAWKNLWRRKIRTIFTLLCVFVTFLLFGILQFHLGLRITPVAHGQHGHFSVPDVLRALARGAACRIDFSDHFDFFRYAAQPLAALRAEWGVSPLPAPA